VARPLIVVVCSCRDNSESKGSKLEHRLTIAFDKERRCSYFSD
jgi:hypothetical protein